jgi:hypothetical protein
LARAEPLKGDFEALGAGDLELDLAGLAGEAYGLVKNYFPVGRNEKGVDGTLMAREVEKKLGLERKFTFLSETAAGTFLAELALKKLGSSLVILPMHFHG